MKFFSFLFSCFAWFLLVLDFAFFMPVLLLISKAAGNKELDNRLVRFFCRLICQSVGLKPSLSPFAENVAKKDEIPFPVIYVANHVSYFDLFLCGAVLPGDPRGFEISTHFSKPFYGWFLKQFGEIPITPGNPATVFAALKQGEKVLRNKERCLLIMPEGHRSRDGALKRFHNGAFFLSRVSQVPIVPVVFENLYEKNNASTYFIRRGKVDIIFGDPVYPQNFEGQEEMKQFVWNSMNQMLIKKEGKNADR